MALALALFIGLLVGCSLVAKNSAFSSANSFQRWPNYTFSATAYPNGYTVYAAGPILPIFPMFGWRPRGAWDEEKNVSVELGVFTGNLEKGPRAKLDFKNVKLIVDGKSVDSIQTESWMDGTSLRITTNLKAKDVRRFRIEGIVINAGSENLPMSPLKFEFQEPVEWMPWFGDL